MSDKFAELRDKRLPRALRELRLLGNLVNYKPDDEEIDDLLAQLEEGLTEVRQKFNRDTEVFASPPKSEDAPTRALVNRPAGVKYHAKRSEAARLEQNLDMLISDIGVHTSTVEFEPDCGFVVVAHVTSEFVDHDDASQYGIEIREMSS